LHDFFGSVDERQVYRIFTALGYEPLISFELARICTRLRASHRDDAPPVGRYAIDAYTSSSLGTLPQGAPTSGALANLAAAQLDKDLTAYAVSHRLVYTRYADDLVLSSSDSFDRAVAVQHIRAVRRQISCSGFLMHEKKTRIVSPGARQVVLGVVLTPDGLRLSREVRSRLENHIRGIELHGLAQHAAHRHFTSVVGLLLHVRGLLAYARDVDEAYAARLTERWGRIEAALNQPAGP
jgi:RNA-directed DNA polymerase